MTEKTPKDWRRERDDIVIFLHEALDLLRTRIATAPEEHNFELAATIDALNRATVDINRLHMQYQFARAMGEL